MLIPTLTLRGLLNYVPDLFEDAVFPEGIQADRVIDALLWEGGDLELLYSHPDYIKQHMPHFCETHLFKWEKLVATMDYEYNPIENYDRREEWTDEGESSSSGSQSNTNDLSNSSTPFNSDTLEVRETNNSEFGSESESAAGFSNDHTGRVHGNIGVTTTQQMIEEERRVSNFNIYKIIAADFIEEFCLQIY